MKNKEIKEYLPSEDDLKSIREEIDAIFNDPYRIHKYPFYEGGGRTVVIIDKFAVKFPEECDSAKVAGNSQNKKEYMVYKETKHPLLNPVYEEYRGCLICKEIIGDLYVLIHDYNFNYNEILSEINCKVNLLSPLIEKYSLDIGDLESPRNWGYDLSIKEFVCLDYGI